MQRGVEGGTKAFMANGPVCDVSRRARGSMWLEAHEQGMGVEGKPGAGSHRISRITEIL